MNGKTYAHEDIITKDTLTTHNALMYLIKIFSIFGIKHKAMKSRTTNSYYLYVWTTDKQDGLKIRISDHAKDAFRKKN